VRQGRLRWSGHSSKKGKDEWLPAYRNVFVTGARGRGRARRPGRLGKLY